MKEKIAPPAVVQSTYHRVVLEIMGWAGVLLELCAYVLISVGKISPHSLTYHFMNVFGCLTLGWCAWDKRNHQSLVINIVWGAMAVFAIIFLLVRLR